MAKMHQAPIADRRKVDAIARRIGIRFVQLMIAGLMGACWFGLLMRPGWPESFFPNVDPTYSSILLLCFCGSAVFSVLLLRTWIVAGRRWTVFLSSFGVLVMSGAACGALVAILDVGRLEISTSLLLTNLFGYGGAGAIVAIVGNPLAYPVSVAGCFLVRITERLGSPARAIALEVK